MPKSEDPPPFRGFQSPRYTQTPNDLFDLLLAPGVLTEAELRVLLYIIRHTFGYGKEIDAISLTQFLEGQVKRDGTILDRGCGLGRAAVVRGIKGLERKGMITVTRRRSTQQGDAINVYSLRWIDESVSREYPKDTGGVSLRNGGSLSEVAEGDSERDSQKKDQNTSNKREEENSDSMGETVSMPVYSPVIAAAVLDLARTLRDELAGPGAVTEALRLWQQSGWTETLFVAALQQAKGRRLESVLQILRRQLEAP